MSCYILYLLLNTVSKFTEVYWPDILVGDLHLCHHNEVKYLHRRLPQEQYHDGLTCY